MGTLILDFSGYGYTFNKIFLKVTKSIYEKDYILYTHKPSDDITSSVAHQFFIKFNNSIKPLYTYHKFTSYKVLEFEVYYAKDCPSVPLIFGFVVEGISDRKREKWYYLFRHAIDMNEEGYNIYWANPEGDRGLKCLTEINSSNLKSKLQEEKSHLSLTIKVQEISDYGDVTVKLISSLGPQFDVKYMSYSHTPKKTGFMYSIITFKDLSEIEGFKPSEYYYPNLTSIWVYLCKDCRCTETVLLIHVKTSSKNGFYLLNEIFKIKNEYKWEEDLINRHISYYKKYKKEDMSEDQVEKRLDEIMEKFRDILSHPENPLTIPLSVGSCSVIGTSGLAFFVYKKWHAITVWVTTLL